MDSSVIIKIGKEKYATEVIIGKHTLVIDEPENIGGKDLGPTPMDLLLSSLGTCKAITMRMYADQKNWPLDNIEISLNVEVDKTVTPQTTRIKVDINLIGDLDDVQKERIIKVGEKCPIHKILTNPVTIETNMIQ